MAPTVLFLHSSASLYGADRQLLSVAGGLDRDRWRPLVVVPERGPLVEELEQAGVETLVRPLAVLRRAVLSPAGLARLAARAAAERRWLPRLVRERGVALVHANTSVVLGWRAAPVPRVVHVREIYAPAGGRAAAALWPALRRSLLGADALVCISAAVARQLGGPGARVTIVYDGLARIPERPPREPARAALGLPDERFAVALLGRVSEWKGQDVLARALAEPPLAEIGAIGLVAGDAFHGRERHERALAALRAELGLGERLRVLGFRDDVGPVLGAVDAVAMPSTRPEPLGNSALEAAAAGLPVVASAHGGLAEVVRDGETGRLVPPGDARALALALRELADHPEGARALGEAATRDVRARFSRERMLAELEWVYERLLPREGERAFDPRGMGSNARSSRSDVP